MNDRSRLDGRGDGDPLKIAAARILNLAINDEIDHRGAAICSPTLGCFIEFRIEEALRSLIPDS